jgi:hypothetical protein
MTENVFTVTRDTPLRLIAQRMLEYGVSGMPTHAQLVRDWRCTLDAFGDALGAERRYFSPSELKRLELHLAADRRWLQHFAAIRNFP